MPWADVLYACDAAWWKFHKGAQDFSGLRIGADARAMGKRYDIKPIKIDTRRDEFMVYRFGAIGFGGNSGFQAINLAVQFGCAKIVLVGFDMHDRNGLHWHGDHAGSLNNPTGKSLARWRAALDAQADALKRMGVAVLNTSKGSALTAFPKVPLDEALQETHGPHHADARQEALAG